MRWEFGCRWLKDKTLQAENGIRPNLALYGLPAVWESLLSNPPFVFFNLDNANVTGSSYINLCNIYKTNLSITDKFV